MDTNKEKLILNGLLFLLVISFIGGWFYMSRSGMMSTAAPAPVSATAPTQELKFAGKKVVFVDSYHQGYEWSDGIGAGIASTFKNTGVELKVIYMDTKRNPSEEFKKQAGREAKTQIDTFQPDVLIVADDNAFKYIVKEYYQDGSLAVVFCGLNWDASVYGAPYKNMTGMVEVSLTPQIIEHLKEYARGERLSYLSADNETERKNLFYYEKLFGLTFTKTYFVKSMAEWKAAFSALQKESDMMIFENSAGIADWNDDEAQAYAEKNTTIPVGTTNAWTMKESLLGITKVAGEQGEWAAGSALEILGGTPASSIALVKNKRGDLKVNFAIAGVLQVKLAPNLLKNSENVQ